MYLLARTSENVVLEGMVLEVNMHFYLACKTKFSCHNHEGDMTSSLYVQLVAEAAFNLSE